MAISRLRRKSWKGLTAGKLSRSRIPTAGGNQSFQLNFALLRLREGFVLAVAGVFRCAWRAVQVSDSDAPAVDFGFGVAESGRFFAMHADGEGAFFREVRSVQRAKPSQAADVFGGQGALEDGLTRLPGGCLVKAGRSPQAGFPSKIQARQFPAVPTPFAQGFARAENSQQSKGADARQWLIGKHCLDGGWLAAAGYYFHYGSTADRVFGFFCFGGCFLSGMPIEQGKDSGRGVGAYPRAAGRLSGTQNGQTAHNARRGERALCPRSQLIAVHAQSTAAASWHENHRAHGQSAGKCFFDSFRQRRQAFHNCRREAGFTPFFRLAAPMAKTISHCRRRIL